MSRETKSFSVDASREGVDESTCMMRPCGRCLFFDSEFIPLFEQETFDPVVKEDHFINKRE